MSEAEVLVSSVIDFDKIIPRIKINNPEYWAKMSPKEKLWDYRVAYFDYKWTRRDLADARWKFHQNFDTKDPLIIEFDIYQVSKLSDKWQFWGVRYKDKWFPSKRYTFLAYDYRHSPFYANDKEILTGKQLKEYKQAIKDMMFETFEGRNFSFPTSSPHGRCLWCSRKLVGKKYKPLNYCRKEPNGKVAYCSTNFNSTYSWQTMRYYIAKRDNYTCQICHATDPKHWDIDHIVEIATAKTNYERAQLFTDEKNMQFLCTDCHKEKTAKFLSSWLSKPQSDKKKMKKKTKSNK